MRLTKEEFSIFNLASRIKIIENDGVYLIKKIVDGRHEIRLYLLYDFYVEEYYDYKQNKVLQVNTVKGKEWLQAFYLDMINQFNFC
jgi:hypothetical protein